MNCRVCKAPLSPGVAYCPQCGSATEPTYAAPTWIAPEGTTVAGKTDATVPPPPPPTSYGPSRVPNPYDPYPIPRRGRGRRVSLIVGILLLVLLLIGGGIYVWLAPALLGHTSNRVATSTPTTQAHASVTASAQPFAAQGTFTIAKVTTTDSHPDGTNQIANSMQQLVFSGSIIGSTEQQETSVIHADKTTTFSGTSRCVCTVAGKSGVLTWSYSGASAADGSFQGQFFDIQGTGDLAKLQGKGTFQGQVSNGTYVAQLSDAA
ncbi:MAG TPA: DUF3224 domain-containing protein [Ktedonobacteraceae bacterium]